MLLTLSMHPLIISGLSTLGTSLLDQTLDKIRSNEHKVINFNAIMKHLSRKGCAKETLNNMKADLLNAILDDPLLNEFRNSTTSILSITIDHKGRCSFQEDGKTILTCSRDSNLGKLGLAYFNISQLAIPTHEQNKEVYLENIA